MITHIYGGAGSGGALNFQPEDEDGDIHDYPVIFSRDNGDSIVLHQRKDTICIPVERFDEFVKAVQKFQKEYVK